MTSTDKVETEEVFNFTLEQRASNVITQRLLGLRPYIILKPELDDNDEPVFHIEVGGGAELEGLGSLLEGIGKLLQDPDAAQEIETKIQAAREAAEQDDEDE